MGYLATSKSCPEQWLLNLHIIFNISNQLMNKVRILLYILRISFSNLLLTNNWWETGHCDGIQRAVT